MVKILQGAPSITFNEDMHEQARTNEPETIAVRLKVLVLLTRYKEINYRKLDINGNGVKFTPKEEENLKILSSYISRLYKS